MKIKVKNVDYVLRLIMKKGHSQSSFCNKVGVSVSYGNQVLNGKRNPSPELADKIVQLLGVDFDDIFFIQNGCKSNHEITA